MYCTIGFTAFFPETGPARDTLVALGMRLENSEVCTVQMIGTLGCSESWDQQPKVNGTQEICG